MPNRRLRLILSDIRSTHNVGSLLRTADACAIELVYACGYTPFPRLVASDNRPAHISAANTRAIAKTALGAEQTVPVLHFADTISAIREARTGGFEIIVLEQSESSLNLYQYASDKPIALVLGNEVTGVSPNALRLADVIWELPMLGRKESLNVAVAGGIAMYQLRFGA